MLTRLWHLTPRLWLSLIIWCFTPRHSIELERYCHCFFWRQPVHLHSAFISIKWQTLPKCNHNQHTIWYPQFDNMPRYWEWHFNMINLTAAFSDVYEKCTENFGNKRPHQHCWIWKTVFFSLKIFHIYVIKFTRISLLVGTIFMQNCHCTVWAGVGAIHTVWVWNKVLITFSEVIDTQECDETRSSMGWVVQTTLCVTM